MKNRYIVIPIIVISFLYAIGPMVAGILKWGDRDGPVIYPESYHEGLFIISHESAHNIKPRLPITNGLYNRPYFYGFSRRPKAKEERIERLNWLKEESPQFYELYLEENIKIEKKLETKRDSSANN